MLAALAERHGAPLPVQTYTVRTASGGEHLYFAAPEGSPLRNTAGRLGWLVDTRASGGYVVAAVARRSRYAAAALRGELDRVLNAVPGTRNHTLNAAAFALGRLAGAGLLPAGLAADALAQATAAIGLPNREAAATIRSGLAAGARHPRTIDRTPR